MRWIIVALCVAGCSGGDEGRSGSKESEPNDSFADASPAGEGAGAHHLYGSIGQDDARDIFRIETATTGAVSGTVEVSGEGMFTVELWQNGFDTGPIVGSLDPATEGEHAITGTLDEYGEPLSEMFVVVLPFAGAAFTYDMRITLP